MYKAALGLVGHNKRYRALTAQTSGAGFFGIEMILSGLAGDNFSSARYSQAFCVGFVGFHKASFVSLSDFKTVNLLFPFSLLKLKKLVKLEKLFLIPFNNH